MPETDAPDFQLLPAADFSLPELTAAYNQARVDYLIPMPMDSAHLEAYTRLYDVDLRRSWLAVDGGETLGIAMLGVRAGRAWVTRLGVLPASRRRGVGERLVRALLDSAHEANCPLAVLEVIRENHKARGLFLKLGFVEIRELLVLRRAPSPPPCQPRISGGSRCRANWLAGEAALDLLNAHSVPPAWTNEIETYRRAADAQALLVDLPPSDGQAAARGWMVFRLHENILSHVILHTATGDPAALCREAVAQVLTRYPSAEGYLENIPADDPHAPELARLGFVEAFRRIEMYRNEARFLPRFLPPQPGASDATASALP